MQKTRRLAVGWALALGLLSHEAAAGIDDLKGTGPGQMPQPNNLGTSERCAGCHRAESQEDQDYMPTDTWAGTMMANAWRDPVFKAALAIANQDKPGVGTFCLRCHSPVGFVNGRATPPDGSGFDPEASVDGKIIDGQAVSCSVCHRAMTTPGPDDRPSYIIGNAQLVFDTTPEAAGFTATPVAYGPYEDVVSESHTGEREPTLAESAFCGQCHQVTNPDVKLRDASGAETAIEFPLDTTFEEWASSDFRDGATPQSCVDCHMQRKIGEFAVGDRGPIRTDPRTHLLVGGNHWGIQAVMAADAARASDYADSFKLALDGTLKSLASAASVTLVEAPQEAAPGEEIAVTVRVENLAGHKFPTGYAESRRAWIAVFLVDESGVERPLLGGYDADTGEIQQDPPTHEYRAVHGKWNSEAGVGEKEEHLARHDMIISDTRIPPKGFVPSQTTQPTQEIDFTDGNGGYRNYDEARFTLTIPADASGRQTLSARVYYQSMTKEYIEFLRSENVSDETGNDLSTIYEETGEAPPLLVAADDAEAPLDLGEPPANASSGNGSGGGNSAGGAGGDGSTGGTTSGSSDDSGCGCRMPAETQGGRLPTVLAGLALAAAAARRRRALRRH
ncbi:MYXO-CTERM sorting domain-containing protein [Sorangium sp. So ce1000]|uniref:MYXO-CTERM sorting domain-containing protein n=1 Tax=Sorangium sp. So ce1000 TaxID=3133325 RepID=UPI003F644A4D